MRVYVICNVQKNVFEDVSRFKTHENIPGFPKLSFQLLYPAPSINQDPHCRSWLQIRVQTEFDLVEREK